MSAALPPKLRIEVGAPQFSGPLVGPDDPYLHDCWAAVLGPTQVLCYRRLHQLAGTQVPIRTLAQSLGMGNSPELARLKSGLVRLADYGVLTLEGAVCQVTPGLRYLTPAELRRTGPIVEGLHAAYLRARQLEPGRIARLALDGSRSLRRTGRTHSVPSLSLADAR